MFGYWTSGLFFDSYKINAKNKFQALHLLELKPKIAQFKTENSFKTIFLHKQMIKFSPNPGAKYCIGYMYVRPITGCWYNKLMLCYNKYYQTYFVTKQNWLLNKCVTKFERITWTVQKKSLNKTTTKTMIAIENNDRSEISRRMAGYFKWLFSRFCVMSVKWLPIVAIFSSTLYMYLPFLFYHILDLTSLFIIHHWSYSDANQISPKL